MTKEKKVGSPIWCSLFPDPKKLPYNHHLSRISLKLLKFRYLQDLKKDLPVCNVKKNLFVVVAPMTGPKNEKEINDVKQFSFLSVNGGQIWLREIS